MKIKNEIQNVKTTEVTVKKFTPRPIYLPKKRLLKHAKNGNKIININILYFTLFTDKIGFEPMILYNTLIFKTSALNRSATYPNF